MRLRGLVSRRRILFVRLLDTLSRSAGGFPRVPLPASSPFCFRSTHQPKQNGGQAMTTINLKDFYYWYLSDELVEVPDEVAEELMASKRREAAHAERVRYNKAYYSLDCDDGIEYSACLHDACTSPAPRSSWIARSCSSGCGTPSIPCRRSRAAGWTLT